MPPLLVQRALGAGEVYGQMQSNPSSKPDDGNKALDFDKIAEEVWPRIRRKLRNERQRERGLHS
jgi:hypothetical protein